MPRASLNGNVEYLSLMLRFHRGSSSRLLSFGTLGTPGKGQAPAPIHPGEGVQSASCHQSDEIWLPVEQVLEHGQPLPLKPSAPQWSE